MMRAITIIFVCVVCSGCARRVQSTESQPNHQQEPSQHVADVLEGPRSFAELAESQTSGVAGRPTPSKTLAAVLLAMLNPANAFQVPMSGHNLARGHHVGQSSLLRPVAVASDVSPSPVVGEIVEKLKTLTLLEASELVKSIEETFGVDASMAAGGGMVMPAGAATTQVDAAPVEEKTEFDLVLESFPPDKKIAVLKVVRAVSGLGLKEAKEFIEAAPKVILEGKSLADTEEFKKQLEEAGAVVAVK